MNTERVFFSNTKLISSYFKTETEYTSADLFAAFLKTRKTKQLKMRKIIDGQIQILGRKA